MTKTTQTSKNQTESRFPTRYIWWGLASLAGLALIVWMAWAIASETEVDEAVAFGEVTVEGEALPTVDLASGDPAVGQEAPTITATDLDGNEVTIGPDGRPKIIVLVAHWCQFCQAEVPILQDWVESGGLPDDVDLYSATVLTNRLRDSSTWPPSEWLESEGWTVTTVKDNQSQAIASSYGLTGTPYYIVLDGDNTNLGRFSGAIGVEGFNTLAGIAQTGLEG
jgi:thiol-disulfide isomerase/thioredoxin